VGLYLKDNTPPAEIEKYKLYQQSQAAYREKGNGKPSGKDRRDLDSFFSWDGDDSNED
jgi:ribosome-associated heat shock protein Hsp15